LKEKNTKFFSCGKVICPIMIGGLSLEVT
jgi:hypothetical protein